MLEDMRFGDSNFSCGTEAGQVQDQASRAGVIQQKPLVKSKSGKTLIIINVNSQRVSVAWSTQDKAQFGLHQLYRCEDTK